MPWKWAKLKKKEKEKNLGRGGIAGLWKHTHARARQHECLKSSYLKFKSGEIFFPQLSAGEARWGSDPCRWVARPLFSPYINTTSWNWTFQSWVTQPRMFQSWEYLGFSKALCCQGEGRELQTPGAWWDGETARSALVNISRSNARARRRTLADDDDDAPQTVVNPVCRGIWPSALERIYAALEGRGEGIKYAWYCEIKTTQ